MAVTSATKTNNLSGGDDEIRETWLVIAGATDSVPTILASALIPAVGAGHTDDSGYRVVRPRTLKPSVGDQKQGYWDAEITWQKRSGGTQSSVSKTTTRLLSLSYGTAPYQVVAEQGYLWDGAAWGASMVPVRNSASDPFDPPPMVPVYNTIIRFRQTEAAGFNANDAVDLIGTINSTALTVCGMTIAAEYGVLRDISPEYIGDDGWESTYAIEVRRQYPLCPELLDQGYNYLVATKKREIRYSDISADYESDGDKADKDKPVSDPVPLDGSGGLLGAGATVYRKYRFGELVAWADTLSLVSTL